MIFNKRVRRSCSVRMISVILVLMITVLAGCGDNTGTEVETVGSQNGNQNENFNDSSNTAMGRYLGRETDIGSMLDSRIADMKQMDDGSIIIQDFNGTRIISKDKGETWEYVPLQWMNEFLTNNFAMQMALAKDGSTAIGYMPIDHTGEEIEAEVSNITVGEAGDESIVIMDQAVGASDDVEEGADTAGEEVAYEVSVAEDGSIVYEEAENSENEGGDTYVTDSEATSGTSDFGLQYMLIDSEGNTIPFKIEGEALIHSMQFSEESELYLQMNGDIYRLNQESGAVEVYLNYPGSIHSFTVENDRMMLVTENGLELYDMEKQDFIVDETANDFLADTFFAEAGETSSAFSTDATNAVSLFPFSETKDILYIAFPQGLFRHAGGGSVMEQVIDGGLSRFGDPSAMIIRVLSLEESEFMALFTGGKVVHYVFDPDTPTVPDQELSVYSLTEDNLMKQAIMLYQSAHPEVFVKYETGMTEGSGTVEDALKNLNTEILAGIGPDIILLDHMPVKSYLEKGMLEDLTPYLNDSGVELIPAVRDTFEQDGKIMALPVQFTVPMAMGNRELVENISDLASFADAAEAYRGTVTDASLIARDTSRSFLTAISQSAAHRWQKEDGSVDDAAIREFLTQAQRIYNLDTGAEGTEESNVSSSPSMVLDALEILGGNSQVTFGNLVSGWDMSLTASAMKAMEAEVGIEAMAGTSARVFLPFSIVGINAASTNKELAGELLKTLLGAEVMEYADYGFPINRTAYEARFETDEEMAGVVTVMNEEGIVNALEVKWPEEEWITHVRTIMESIDTPDLTDEMVKEVVFEEGAAVLDGSKTMDEAVADIINRVSIYVAE